MKIPFRIFEYTYATLHFCT
ncbi:uncharacterized protein DNG_00428 [Cephalotrichum gorgonifer]|uniref:Uncharacterized protein n=1 Tax=Cephalotrichum gorgonifer TaxID=2041049 RepID=A0AAE8MQD3_9PEZI|nr:uncharacterized protein DNG_00428 [Cephalotrichum gorgonifer]